MRANSLTGTGVFWVLALAGCSSAPNVTIAYQHRDLDGAETSPELVAIRPAGGSWIVERRDPNPTFDIPAGAYTLAVVHDCDVGPEVWTVDATTDELTALTWMPCVGGPVFANDEMGNYFYDVPLDAGQRLEVSFGMQTVTASDTTANQVTVLAGTHDVVLAVHDDGEATDRIALDPDVTVVPVDGTAGLDFDRFSVATVAMPAAVAPGPYAIEALWVTPTTVGRIPVGSGTTWTAIPEETLGDDELQVARVFAETFTQDTADSYERVEFMRAPRALDVLMTSFAPQHPVTFGLDDAVLARVDAAAWDDAVAWCLQVDTGQAYWRSIFTVGALDASGSAEYAVPSLRDLPGWDDAWAASLDDGWSDVSEVAVASANGVGALLGAEPVDGDVWTEGARAWRGEVTSAHRACVPIYPR